MSTPLKTKGIHPKVPAVLTPVLLLALSRIEQSGTVDTTAGLLLLIVLVGAAAGYFAPAANLEPIEQAVADIAVGTVEQSPVTAAALASAVAAEIQRTQAADAVTPPS